MNSKEIEFWDKTMNRFFWLGTALAGAIALNAIVKYQQDKNQTGKKDKKPLPSADESDQEALSATKRGSKRKVHFDEINGDENGISNKLELSE